MPKLSRDEALRTLHRAELQEFDRMERVCVATNAPDDVLDSLYANEPPQNFDVWLHEWHLRGRSVSDE